MQERYRRVWIDGKKLNKRDNFEKVKRVAKANDISKEPEADLGMFSMFGRTRAPTKRGPPQKHKNYFMLQ